MVLRGEDAWRIVRPMTRRAAVLALVLALIAAAAPAREPVTVFAAASLRGALEELAATHDAPVQLSFGGSGTIARQVAAGAPVDLVVLASPLWMDWLVAQGAVAPEAVRMIAGNALVLIGPADAPPLPWLEELPARLGTGRLAMGHREAVPAGSYARQWLQAAGVWEALEDRLAETDNVRAALALVLRGQAPLGIVYASDARATEGVAVLAEAPPGAHDPILYPAAALTDGGAAFLALITGARGREALARHGFLPVQP